MRRISTRQCMLERIIGREKAIKHRKFSNTVSCLIRSGSMGNLNFLLYDIAIPMDAMPNSTCIIILYI